MPEIEIVVESFPQEVIEIPSEEFPDGIVEDLEVIIVEPCQT